MASVQCRKTFTENYGTMQNESFLNEMKLNKLSVENLRISLERCLTLGDRPIGFFDTLPSFNNS